MYFSNNDIYSHKISFYYTLSIYCNNKSNICNFLSLYIYILIIKKMGNCVGAEENEWEFKTIDEVKNNRKDVR